jgi:Zn-dependent protease
VDLFGENWLAERTLLLVPVLLSLSVHEFAHAWAAFRLGDYTAYSQGRLTLNPVVHIDPVGLLLPLLGIPFGWAKPVPVNLGAMRKGVSMRSALVLTAAAGPISNLLLALLCTVAMGLLSRVGMTDQSALWRLLEWMVLINAILAFFNLLPVPPLDGGRIAEGLCPRSMRAGWDAFARMGPVALVAAIALPFLFGVSLFEAPMHHTQVLLDVVFRWVSEDS